MPTRTEILAALSPSARAAVARQLGQPVTPAPASVPRDPYRSQLERDYAAHLDMLKGAGEVEWWAYEAVRLRIADGKREAFYKPDFTVILMAGETEFHECKGFWRTADRLRIKVAASRFPWRFIGIQRDGAGWKREEF
jgi:predicted secreted hydrolase